VRVSDFINEFARRATAAAAAICSQDVGKSNIVTTSKEKSRYNAVKAIELIGASKETTWFDERDRIILCPMNLKEDRRVF
jgi:hypothetical protein